MIRSATLGLRGELYIEAARISGLTDAAIIARHVLPRSIGPLIVQLSLFAALAVIVQTGISFLGLGIQPPAPTWGGMIFEASASLNDFPWLLLPSGGVVVLTLLAFGMLGDSLRDSAVEAWARPASLQRRTVDQRQVASAAAGTASGLFTDAPAGAVLSLRGLCISTGQGEAQRTLVHQLRLDLMPAETLGQVGESGSGKTLSILALMGLLPAGSQVTAGTLRLNGREIDLADAPALAALRGTALGMIFQEPMAALDPCFSIGQHLAKVIRRHAGGSRSAARARAVELPARLAPAGALTGRPGPSHHRRGGARLSLPGQLPLCPGPARGRRAAADAQVPHAEPRLLQLHRRLGRLPQRRRPAV